MKWSPKGMAKQSVGIEDLSRFRWLHGATLSPDGNTVVYGVLSTINIQCGVKHGVKDRKSGNLSLCAKDKECVTLFRIDLKSRVVRQLTAGTYRDSSPKFSPDGRTLAFTSDRRGKPQIHLLPMDGGEALALTDLKQGASHPVWSPDGKRIAFTAGLDLEGFGAEERRGYPYRVTRKVWRFNDAGNLDFAVRHIYMIDLPTGEIHQLTRGQTMDSEPKWSPDGRRILFCERMAPGSLNVAFFGSLCAVDMEGRVERYMDGWAIESKAWLHNDRCVVVGKKVPGSWSSNADLYVLDLNTGSLEKRTVSLERNVQGLLEGRTPCFSPDLWECLVVARGDRFVYGRLQDGGRVEICKVALDGDEAVNVVVGGNRCCLLMDMASDRLLFSVDDICNPPDLYIANADGSDEVRLTNLNEEVLKQYPSARHVRLSCKGTDGEPVEGWYVEPTNGAKAPFPSILWIHGGPHGAQGHTFAVDTLLLNRLGFGVMFFNHRGSTGYGNAFCKGALGDWGNLDYHDLIAGVDAAISAGLADPERLGVCGNSGGGTLSCFIAGKSSRFKAAVPQNPLTEWVSFYGTSDMGVWFSVEEMGGNPNEMIDTYRKCSPLTYAGSCKTPMLLIQGEEDWRCPPNQSEQFYTALCANDCVVEMLRLPCAAHYSHVIGSLETRKAYLLGMVEWFQKYVLAD